MYRLYEILIGSYEGGKKKRIALLAFLLSVVYTLATWRLQTYTSDYVNKKYLNMI